MFVCFYICVCVCICMFACLPLTSYHTHQRNLIIQFLFIALEQQSQSQERKQRKESENERENTDNTNKAPTYAHTITHTHTRRLSCEEIWVLLQFSQPKFNDRLQSQKKSSCVSVCVRESRQRECRDYCVCYSAGGALLRCAELTRLMQKRLRAGRQREWERESDREVEGTTKLRDGRWGRSTLSAAFFLSCNFCACCGRNSSYYCTMHTQICARMCV